MRTIGCLSLAIFSLLALARPIRACDDRTADWTVVTVAWGGAWGVATQGLASLAIAAAIQACKGGAGAQSDCGARFTAIRGGWTVAALCGDHPIIVAERSLADAETRAMRRERELRLLYVPNLPACRRVLTVDPAGTVFADGDLAFKQ